MRLIALLLLSVLLSVFVGLAAPFSSASADDCGRCCSGETGEEKNEADPASPCNAVECPCGFCLPAVLPGTVEILPPDSPVHAPLRSRIPICLTAFPDAIDYPPERLSLI